MRVCVNTGWQAGWIDETRYCHMCLAPALAAARVLVRAVSASLGSGVVYVAFSAVLIVLGSYYCFLSFLLLVLCSYSCCLLFRDCTPPLFLLLLLFSAVLLGLASTHVTLLVLINVRKCGEYRSCSLMIPSIASPSSVTPSEM